MWLVLLEIALGANCISGFGEDLPCDLNFGIDISDGVVRENGSIFKDEIVFTKDNYVVNSDDGKKIGCICRIKPCIRKCCPMDEMMVNRTCRPSNSTFVIPPDVGPPLESYHVAYGSDCPNNTKVKLYLDRRLPDGLGNFELRKDGVIYLAYDNIYYHQENYCMDHIDEDFLKPLMCITEEKELVSPLNVVGIVVSLPFLVLTFVAYALLPERNLHGRCLMCYVFSLFFANILLIIIQHNPDTMVDTNCIVTAMFCYFFYLVSFLFMNVMSFDIWWTFRSIEASSNKKEGEKKRFMFYCIYALGIPVLLVITVLSLLFTLEHSFEWYSPGVAYGQCWFTKGFPTFIYYYLLISIVIASNMVFFSITAYKIKKIQNSTAVLRADGSKEHKDSNKRKFNLYLKLSIAMGVTWSWEIISWAIDWKIGYIPPPVWYFGDFLNAIYGIFIFLIFVFKKSMWKKLKARFEKIMENKKLSRTATVLGLRTIQKINEESNSTSTNKTTVSGSSEE